MAPAGDSIRRGGWLTVGSEPGIRLRCPAPMTEGEAEKARVASERSSGIVSAHWCRMVLTRVGFAPAIAMAFLSVDAKTLRTGVPVGRPCRLGIAAGGCRTRLRRIRPAAPAPENVNLLSGRIALKVSLPDNSLLIQILVADVRRALRGAARSPRNFGLRRVLRWLQNHQP